MSKSEKKLSLREMEQQLDGELSHLRTQMAKLTETLETDPAEWIGNHPYAAAGSAALAGFVIAQIPLPRLKTKPERAKPRESRENDDGREDRSGALMTLLTNLAHEYLTRGSPCATEAQEDGAVMVADAGAVRGAAFPSDFASRSTDTPETQS